MKRHVLVGALLYLVVAPVVAAGSAAEVRALVEAKRFAEAHAAGKASGQGMGEPEFDFFWGYAAIEADHPGDGVLALQRYLLRTPGDAVAQFLLARGYFALGEDDSAKAEFQALSDNANPEIAGSATKYLAAIAERDARTRPNFSAYLGMVLGYDNNITSGIDRGTAPSIPGFGVLPTQPNASTGVAAADGFAGLNGGLSYAYPLSPTRRVVMATSAEHRQMLGADNRMFDQQGLRGDASYVVESDLSQYRFGLGVSQSWVDHRRYLQSQVLGGEWVRVMGERDRLALNLQYGEQRFAKGCSYFLRDLDTPCVDSDNAQRDSRITSLGVGWAHQASGVWSPLYQLGVTYGKEQNQADQPSLSRSMAGVRGGVKLTPRADQQMAVGLSWQASRYDENYPVASVPRDDDLYSLDVSWQMQWSKRWLVMVDASVARQASNIGLYDYDRATMSLGVRRLFD